MKLLLHIALVAATAYVAWSCSATGCTENQNSVPLAGFYSMQTGQAISVDSLAIGGVGAPNDSLLVSPSTSASQTYLPFRASKSSTSFYVEYRQASLNFPELNDTLTFDYEARPYFASEECGAMYHYLITRFSYTTHLIDSVAVTDSLITNIDRESIKIYFRTSTTPNGEERQNQKAYVVEK